MTASSGGGKGLVSSMSALLERCRRGRAGPIRQNLKNSKGKIVKKGKTGPLQLQRSKIVRRGKLKGGLTALKSIKSEGKIVENKESEEKRTLQEPKRKIVTGGELNDSLTGLKSTKSKGNIVEKNGNKVKGTLLEPKRKIISEGKRNVGPSGVKAIKSEGKFAKKTVNQETRAVVKKGRLNSYERMKLELAKSNLASSEPDNQRNIKISKPVVKSGKLSLYERMKLELAKSNLASSEPDNRKIIKIKPKFAAKRKKNSAKESRLIAFNNNGKKNQKIVKVGSSITPQQSNNESCNPKRPSSKQAHKGSREENRPNLMFNGVVEKLSANGVFVRSEAGMSFFAPYEIQNVPSQVLKVNREVRGTIVCSDFSRGRFIAKLELNISPHLNESIRHELKVEFRVNFQVGNSNVTSKFNLGFVRKFFVSEILGDGSLIAGDNNTNSNQWDGACVGRVPAFLVSRIIDWKPEIGQDFEAVVVDYDDDFEMAILAPAIVEGGFHFKDGGVYEISVVSTKQGFSVGLSPFSNNLILFKPKKFAHDENLGMNRKVYVKVRIGMVRSHFCLADQITENQHKNLTESSDDSLQCIRTELVQQLTSEFSVGTVVNGKIDSFEAAFVCVSLSGGKVTGKIFMGHFKPLLNKGGTLKDIEREGFVGKFVTAVVCGYLASADGSDCSLLLITSSSSDQIPESSKYYKPMRIDTDVVCVTDLIFFKNVDVVYAFIESVQDDSIAVRILPFLRVTIPNFYISSEWMPLSENIGKQIKVRYYLTDYKRSRCLAVDADLDFQRFNIGDEICLHKFDDQVFYGLWKLNVVFQQSAEKELFLRQSQGFQFVAQVVHFIRKTPQIRICHYHLDGTRRLPKGGIFSCLDQRLFPDHEQPEPEPEKSEQEAEVKREFKMVLRSRQKKPNVRSQQEELNINLTELSEIHTKSNDLKERLKVFLGDSVKESSEFSDKLEQKRKSEASYSDNHKSTDSIEDSEEKKRKIDESPPREPFRILTRSQKSMENGQSNPLEIEEKQRIELNTEHFDKEFKRYVEAIDKSDTKTIDNSNTKPIDKSNTKTIDNSNTKPIDKSNAKTIDKSNTKPIDKSNTKTIDKSNTKSNDRSCSTDIYKKFKQIVETIDKSEQSSGMIDANWSDEETEIYNVASKKSKVSDANAVVSLENYESYLQSLNNSQEQLDNRKLTQSTVATASNVSNPDRSVLEKLQLAVKADSRSCKQWLNYIDYYIQLSDIANIREICRKAVDSIDDLKYDDKLQVWTRLLSSEVKLGTQESVQEIFDIAIQRNNPLQTHFVMAEIWEDNSNFSKAVETYKLAIKKFKNKKEAWLKYLEFLFKNKKFSDAAELVSASFVSLTKQEQVEIILKKSQFEFKYGEVERGKTNFEHLLSTYPKRVDIWSDYMHCLIEMAQYDEVRSLFSRVLTLDLRPFKLKPIFKLYLNFERTYGTSDLFQKWSDEFEKRFNGVEASQ